MMGLPPGLRCYLWAVYLACLGLVAAAAASLVAAGAMSRPSLVLLQSVAVFILLAYAGERTTLQVSGAVAQSLATSVHIAAILIFPSPYPLLVTLLSVLAGQTFHARKPLHKRAFNVCHATLTVG